MIQENALPDKIGDYQIVRSLGQGGMGVVYLAYDPICKRHIALKQLRDTLSQNSSSQKRFLREALIAAHLSHPSIVPIYSIHNQKNSVFYTMPHVKGETLKEIIKVSQEQQKEGEVEHPIGHSIPALAHIFLKVCQAMAYAHAKGILHRDLKPDNIIVGKYGEVLLFDWGLAEVVSSTLAPAISSEATLPKAIPGTLLYLAPERILGKPSSVQTDIFALGVILYQILTLQIPFRRKSLEQVRKTLHLENVIDPLEAAPYRDIPQHLADVVKRCLYFEPKERFQSVDEIITEVNSYIEGKPEWIPTAELDIDKKSDWEFQENVLIAKHMAITRSPEVLEWVSLMVSSISFSGNMRLQTQIRISDEGKGIGILFAIPENVKRKRWIEEGYYLWLGSENEPGLRIFQCNVEVMTLPDVTLKKNSWHQLTIELLGSHLYVYLDDNLRCHYASHVPMIGAHVGLLCRDADFTLKPLQISVGSQNAMVNCLAVPDSFLANKNYAKALVEYRRIASSFAGRTEGREALFRAGITLLQQAMQQKGRRGKEKLYAFAQEEFSKLRFTPAAPLEFLGKSLIYKALKDIEEEEKCLELALRKYPKHPLIKVIVEHITFRLHETSHRHRIAAFHFLLLAALHAPTIFNVEDNMQLFNSLKAHLEPLAFLLPMAQNTPFSQERLFVAVQIAFWLAKPRTLIEMIQNAFSEQITCNAFICLLLLNQKRWVAEHASVCPEKDVLHHMLLAEKEGFYAAIEKLLHTPITAFSLRCIYSLLDDALKRGKAAAIIPLFESLSQKISDTAMKSHFDVLFIWTYLLQDEWEKAHHLLQAYPAEILTDEYSPFYVPMGCYLSHAQGEKSALSHFSGAIDLPYPPTSMLLGFYLRGTISEKQGWIASAFTWEKIQLFRQLHLYYHCNPYVV